MVQLEKFGICLRCCGCWHVQSYSSIKWFILRNSSVTYHTQRLTADFCLWLFTGLLRYCESRCSHLVDLDNIVSYYIHAKVYNATQLLAYCEGFLLQNMVALLTYDDSVKRLLFGKRGISFQIFPPCGLKEHLNQTILSHGYFSAFKSQFHSQTNEHTLS